MKQYHTTGLSNASSGNGTYPVPDPEPPIAKAGMEIDTTTTLYVSLAFLAGFIVAKMIE